MAYDESTAWFRVQLCNLLLVVHCCEERFWLFLAVTFWSVKNFDDLVHSCIKTCCNSEKKYLIGNRFHITMRILGPEILFS